MNIYWPYVMPLLVVVAMVATTGIFNMLRTALALLAAWAVKSAAVYASGIFDLWLFFMIVDAAAAWVVLYHPAGRIQSIIGGLILAKFMVHGIYGLSKFFNPESVDGFAYIHLLDIVGFLELGLLGGWAGGRGISALHSRYRRRRLRLVGAEGSGGLA